MNEYGIKTDYCLPSDYKATIDMPVLLIVMIEYVFLIEIMV